MENCENENSAIAVNVSPERPFCVFICNSIPSKDVAGGFGSPSYCLPLFSYADKNNERRENVTPEALRRFQEVYSSDITRADIFHYIYALLHHPVYRVRYAANLKRELPRIPFVGLIPSKKGNALASFFPLAAAMQNDAEPHHNLRASAQLFRAFAGAGKKLTYLHLNYESAQEFPLKRLENKAVKLDWRVEAMRLNKDKGTLIYNEFLTLGSIPPKVYDYRLGNRSALE